MTGRMATVLVAGVAVVAMLSGCTRVTRPIYGVTEGLLASCTGIPGCVSTQARTEPHEIEPITFASLRSDARSDLLTVLRTMDDHRVVSSHRSYLRSEFMVDDLIDDVEFYMPLEERVIHMRAVTREGMRDSGVNRERLEDIRRLFLELQERR